MYTADAITQGYLSVNTREYDCKIEIYDSGGVLQDTITQSDGLIYPFTIDHSIQAGDYFTIGSIHSSSLNLALDDSVTVPTNGEFRVFLRLNGTSGYGNWIPMGRWSVDRRYPSGTNVIIYDCFDDLVRAETEYISALTYPTTLQAVWNEVISQAGLTSSVTLPSVTVTAAISGQTCRNALGDIAGRVSGSVIIDRDGEVDIVYPYQNITSALTVDKSKYDIFVEIDGTSRTISRVTCIYNDNGDYITLGDDTGYEMIFYSTLIRSTADLQDVFDDYDGLSFFPYTNLEWIGDPRTDCGDLITVTDKNDVDQTVYVMTNKLHYGGGLSMTNTSMVYSETESEFPDVGYGKERLIRKSIIQGVPYYGVAINTDFGIKITRSDGVSETTINSDTWEVLIDGVQKLYADYAEGKLIFDGTLTADVIEAIQTVITADLTAEKAVIAELTVDRLNTSDAVGNYLGGDTSDIDYIDIRDEEISFWTASTTGASTVQVTNRNFESLYWIDDTFRGTTTEATDYPVLRYVYETELQKMKIEFENVDGTREPIITMGAGTGVGKNGQTEIRKAIDGFRITYYDSSTGDESFFVMSDDGNIISPGINPVDNDNNSAVINLTAATPLTRSITFDNIQETYQNFIFSAEMTFPTDAKVTVKVDQDTVTQYNKTHFVKSGGDTLTLSKLLQSVTKGSHQVDVTMTSDTTGTISVNDYDAEVQQFPNIYDAPEILPSFDFTLVTTTANEVFESPLVVGTSGSIEVDWGDSNTETVTTAGRISHTYTTAGQYTVKVKDLTDSTLSFNFAPSKNAIIRIETQIPELFTFENGIDLNDCFRRMEGLVSVPSRLFEKVASQIVLDGTTVFELDMSDMFEDCISLTKVPDDFVYFDMTDLSQTVTDVDAASMFEGCTSLVNAPRLFLDHIDMAVDSDFSIRRMFYQCTNLRNASKIKDDYTGLNVVADSMYYECENLETIEDRLLENCRELTASTAFLRCYKLKSTGRGIFYGYEGYDLDANGDVDIGRFFEEAVIESIDPNFFEGLVNATSLANGIKKIDRTFLEVETDEVPSGLFDPLDGMEEISNTFRDSTISTIPSGLFSGFTSNIELSYVFEGCTNLKTIPTDLFDGNDFITSVNGMFDDCTGVTAYPSGLLDGMTALNDLSYTFKNCTGMTNAADDIWNDYPLATSTECFNGATNLFNYASIPAGWK